MSEDGRYYNSGNKNLYTKISGSGEPVVVIEPGLGILSTEWYYIREELSKFTTVLCYDRAGYAESPRGKQPRTSSQISGELYTMLSEAGINGQVIFIAESEGAIYSLHFTVMFPGKVSGLVLVDPITPKYAEFKNLNTPTYKEKLSDERRVNFIRKYVEYDKEELHDFLVPYLEGMYPSFTEDIQNQLLVYQTDKKLYQSIIDEYDAIEESCSAVLNLGDFPAIPVKVLCRDFENMLKIAIPLGVPSDEVRMVEELWLSHCKDLLNLSPNSELYVIRESSHLMHLSSPQAIIESALKMIKEFRPG